MLREKSKQKIRNSLKMRIFALVSVSMLLLSSVFVLFLYNHEKKNLIDMSIQHNLAMIRQTAVTLDDHLAQMDAMARTIGNTHLVDYILQADPGSTTPLEYMQEIAHIRETLDIYTANDPHIQITIYDEDGIAPVISSSSNINPGYDFTQDPIYTAFRETMNDMLILCDNPQNYFSDPSESGIFTFAYRLRSRYTQTPIGYLVLDIQTESVQQFLSLEDHPNWSGAILAQDNTLIVNSGYPMEQETILGILEQSKGNSYFILGSESIVFTTQSDFSGWTILSVIDYQAILRAASPVSTFVPVLLVVMCILAVVISMFLSHYISKPVTDLANSIQEVSEGHLDTTALIHHSDEIGQLAERFNEMLVRIQNLIIKNEKESSLREKAQLQELQNRVNPHFIYNTLELISSFSTSPNANNIRAICNHLSSMMRYSLRPGNLVPLRDELGQVTDYLAIMEQRLGRQFSYELVVTDDSVMNEDFCKMALQPLVENCIKHGFRNLGHNGMICITVGRQQNCLYCLIQDNGCGVPPEKLKQLNAAIENTVPSNETLLATPYHGVLNVYTRLLMLFGDRLEFRLASREHAGTSITIMIELENNGTLSNDTV